MTTCRWPSSPGEHGGRRRGIKYLLSPQVRVDGESHASACGAHGVDHLLCASDGHCVVARAVKRPDRQLGDAVNVSRTAS